MRILISFNNYINTNIFQYYPSDIIKKIMFLIGLEELSNIKVGQLVAVTQRSILIFLRSICTDSE